MIDLNGIQLKVFPFQNIEMIGLLLYHEYPSTTFYRTSEGVPLIVEWADCSAEHIDRYFAYECTETNFLNFFNGGLSHLELIKSAKKDLIVVFEGDVHHAVNPRIVYFENLPVEYLPESNLFLNKEEIVEYDKILAGIQSETQVINYQTDHTFPVLIAEPSLTYSANSKDEPTIPASKKTYYEFSMVIKFTGLNYSTGQYSFIDKNAAVFKGHFIQPLRQLIPDLDLNSFYTVKINRILEKTSGKTVDTMISCVKKE